MRFLLRTLSLSYVRRHRAKTLLTLLGVVVGVATYVAVAGARDSLLGGIRETVDRMAGKAQLQLTQEGGVPEELQEAIRERPGIRAQSPVIEQVVVPGRGELGSLLVLGVDLLGDREMRDYGFEGEDADLDDPLLFLAQPDSVALAMGLAERAGLKAGDSLVLNLPAGPRSVTVRGLLTPKGFAESFGGNLVVMDVYAAQELFGRGRRFDRLEVRLEEGVTLEEGAATLRAAVPPNVKVETPERRSAQMERLVANFAAGFDVTSGFALGIGAFLIYNAFSVAVNRRRRDVGTLRALGATPRQVQALFLLEGLALGLVGSVLGVLAGAGLTRGALDVMRQGAEQVYGVAASSQARLDLPLVLSGLALGLLASFAGAFAPSRAAAAVSPTEAFAKGVHQAGGAWSLRRVAAGLAVLAATVALGVRPPVAGMPMILGIVALGAVSILFLVGPVSNRLLAFGAPLVARFFPVAGRLASDALLSSPRRSAGTVTAMTLALTFAVGIGGYIEATTATLVRWMRDVLTSDVYVRASANFARPDYRFAPEVKDELLAVPGVRSIESYRAPRLEYRGETIVLASIDMEPMLDRTRHDWVEGNEEAARREVGRGASCTVSDNFARKFGMGVGDVVELPGPRGTVRFPIAAVVKDYTSDRGHRLRRPEDLPRRVRGRPRRRLRREPRRGHRRGRRPRRDPDEAPGEDARARLDEARVRRGRREGDRRLLRPHAGDARPRPLGRRSRHRHGAPHLRRRADARDRPPEGARRARGAGAPERRPRGARDLGGGVPPLAPARDAPRPLRREDRRRGVRRLEPPARDAVAPPRPAPRRPAAPLGRLRLGPGAAGGAHPRHGGPRV